VENVPQEVDTRDEEPEAHVRLLLDRLRDNMLKGATLPRMDLSTPAAAADAVRHLDRVIELIQDQRRTVAALESILRR
jgi:hypothetical protein